MAKNVSLGIALGLGLPPAYAGLSAWQSAKTLGGNETPQGIAINFLESYVGYNLNTGTFDAPQNLARTLGFAVGGVILHKLAVKFKINQYLPKGVNI